jgi:hypothetical protein
VYSDPEWKRIGLVQNSPSIPIAAFVVALILVVATVVSSLTGLGGQPALTELQIGFVAWAFMLVVFAVQGAISIALEGRQVHLGTTVPRLTALRSAAIVGLSVLLLALAGLVGLAIVSGQPTAVVGSTAAAGCLVLALLLLVYKEAFIGHEAHLDPREDDVPW